MFLAAVRAAVKETDFDDRRHFSGWHRDLYKIMAAYGCEAVLDVVDDTIPDGVADFEVARNSLLMEFCQTVGCCIFDKIPVEIRRRFVPYNDVRFMPWNDEFVLQFSQLEVAPSPSGASYYAKGRPTIRHQGVELTVGFTRHAIERICERLDPEWLSYVGAGNVHHVIATCRHFEVVELEDGKPAFTFYSGCGIKGGVRRARYVLDVMGADDRDGGDQAQYRIGYCPFVEDRGFAKATTFLFPGYSATPEHGLLMRSSLPYAEKRRLKELATNNSGEKVVYEGDTEAIRWFHENGVPQVMQFPADFYTGA